MGNGRNGRTGYHNSVEVSLVCGHVILFSIMPLPHDTLWCVKCMDNQHVLEIQEWKIVCHNCKYSRRFGQAALTAQTRASAHACKRQHTVDVYYYGELQHVSETVTQTLPIFDAPPF